MLEEQSNVMAAFSDKLTELSEALNILYISNNASARRRFRESWPEIAGYIFDSQLTQYDVEGLSAEQREHRCELEAAAEIRRIELKQTIKEIVDKSVKSGALQFEYVGSVIDKHDPVVAYYLYAEDVIKRVRPDVVEQVKQIRGVSEDTALESAADEQTAGVDDGVPPEVEEVPLEEAFEVTQDFLPNDTEGEQIANIQETQQEAVFEDTAVDEQQNPAEGTVFEHQESESLIVEEQRPEEEALFEFEGLQPITTPDLLNLQEAMAAQNAPLDVEEALSHDAALDLQDVDSFVQESVQDDVTQQSFSDLEGRKFENINDEGVKKE